MTFSYKSMHTQKALPRYIVSAINRKSPWVAFAIAYVRLPPASGFTPNGGDAPTWT